MNTVFDREDLFKTISRSVIHTQVDLIKLGWIPYVRQCLMEWKTNNPYYNIEQDIDLSSRYYERNLACKTLSIGQPPNYRLIYNHPLLPQNFNLS